MIYHVAAPVLIAFAISAVSGPVVIPFLRRLKVGQTEREELKSHLKKTGTVSYTHLVSIIWRMDMEKILSLHELEKAIECQRSRVDAMVYAGMYSEDFMRRCV